jgi:hypothetical protein
MINDSLWQKEHGVILEMLASDICLEFYALCGDLLINGSEGLGQKNREE